MRFASVLHEGDRLAVAVLDDRAIPFRGVDELGIGTPLELLADPPRERRRSLPVDELAFRPVVPRPGKIICVGLNYAAHAAEARREPTEHPTLFAKFAGSLCGPYDDIACPPESGAVDSEGELAVVIGAHARRIPRELAMSCVAGVTVANDVTMRDFQTRTSQWLAGKAWEASTPVGPELVTLDEAGDLRSLRLRTTVGSLTLQDATTDLMLFDVATLISEISVFAALAPGDLILTGTPEGVGFRRSPPRLLGPGDVVEIQIDGIGRLRNRFCAG